jgi:hypothetical protein
MSYRPALLLAATLAATPAAAVPGRLYSYVRANTDGSEAERVHVFHRGPGDVAVAKMRAPCTNAAYVTATLDPRTGETRSLTGGRLARDGSQQAFAFLTVDPAGTALSIRAELPSGPLTLTAPVGHRPWHLYDFDLASLTVTGPAPTGDFSFGLPLLLVGAEGPHFSDLGRADARYVATETRDSRAVRRYEVGGPAFGAKGGPLWLDAAQGHVVEARFGLPNHAEYRDFHLRLTGTSEDGAAEWKRLTTAHWAGCPSR